MNNLKHAWGIKIDKICISEEKELVIKTLLENGILSQEKIAEKLHLSTRNVQDVKKKFNIPTRKNYKLPMSDEKENAIYECLKNGDTHRFIKNKFGVGHTLIFKIRNKYKVKIKSNYGVKMTINKEYLIYESYLKGKTYANIQKKFGVSSGTIVKIKNKYKLLFKKQ